MAAHAPVGALVTMSKVNFDHDTSTVVRTYTVFPRKLVLPNDLVPPYKKYTFHCRGYHPERQFPR